MLNLDLLGNSDSRHTLVNSEAIHHAVEGLENEHHRAFIKLCLQEDPGVRPKASALLKHRVLQEVGLLHTHIYTDLRTHKCTYIIMCIHILTFTQSPKVFNLKVLSARQLFGKEVSREQIEAEFGKM